MSDDMERHGFIFELLTCLPSLSLSFNFHSHTYFQRSFLSYLLHHCASVMFHVVHTYVRLYNTYGILLAHAGARSTQTCYISTCTIMQVQLSGCGSCQYACAQFWSGLHAKEGPFVVWKEEDAVAVLPFSPKKSSSACQTKIEPDRDARSLKREFHS